MHHLIGTPKHRENSLLRNMESQGQGEVRADGSPRKPGVTVVLKINEKSPLKYRTGAWEVVQLETHLPCRQGSEFGTLAPM